MTLLCSSQHRAVGQGRRGATRDSVALRGGTGHSVALPGRARQAGHGPFRQVTGTMWRGKAGQSRHSQSRLGASRQGRLGRLCGALLGASRQDPSRLAAARQGKAGRAMLGTVRRDPARLGMARPGKARQAWQCSAWPVEFRLGKAGRAELVSAHPWHDSGRARFGKAGSVRSVWAWQSGARLGKAGRAPRGFAWCVQARPVPARQGRLGRAGRDAACPG
jgi:hypothetical protein